MIAYEKLGDTTLQKLESLTDDEILFVITHCTYNFLKKQNSDITDDDEKSIQLTVGGMAVYFVQLTNMHNISADELESKIKQFIKKHENSIAKYSNKPTGEF